MTRDEALALIRERREDVWGERPQHLSLSGLRAMLDDLAPRAIQPSGVAGHYVAEVAALCLMLLESEPRP